MIQNNTNSLDIIKWHLTQISNLTQALVQLSEGLSQGNSIYDNIMEDILHKLSTLIDLEINCINQEIESLE